MKTLILIIKGQRGSTFITSLIATLMMVLTGAYLFQMNTQDNHLIGRLKRSAQAQMLAEAGLGHALGIMGAASAANWVNVATTASNFPLTTLAPGTFDASVQTLNGRYLVSSVGTAQGVSRTVTAEVTPPVLSALSFALASGGNVTWDAGTGGSTGTLTGDIYASGNVSFDPTVNGDVVAGGNISGTNNGSQTQSNAVAFPTVSSAYYQAIAQTNGFYINGNQSYGSGAMPANPAGGVIFVNGNVTITGVQNTTACLFATGNVVIQKSGSLTPKVTINQYSNYPALVALGNIVISSTGNSTGGAAFTSNGLIYAGGNFDISGNHYDNPRVDITGSIIARGNISTNLTAQNNLQVTYAAQSPPGFTVPNATMSIVSYNT